jgi:hypothetical protein
VEPTVAEFDAVVNEVIGLLPEVEELYRSGRNTRRMQRMPEAKYGFGQYKFSKGTWILYSIPLFLALYVAIALFLANTGQRAPWLLRWVPLAILLLAGWCWMWWKAHRR